MERHRKAPEVPVTQMQTLEQEVKIVFDLLGEMFDRVDEQLADAVNAMFGNDTRLAHRVRETDRKVDALELKIDRGCIYILGTFHPEATILRKIIAAMRINADLERIGDLCKNVAKKVIYVEQSTLWRSQTHIIDMADAVRTIVREAREAFIRQDRLKARQVLAYDRQVDRAYREVIEAIIALCHTHPGEAEALVHLVTMSKALERIADHAKSIVRSVVFFIEGVDIRHQKVQRTAGGVASSP